MILYAFKAYNFGGNMDLRVLRYFLAVAREESISRAAQAVHITQPSLSRQIMDLERELKTKLFERGRKKRRLMLTPAGALLRKRAEEIVELFRKGDPDVVATGANALRWQLIAYPLGAFTIISNMMLQTIRKSVRATILSSARQGLFFVPFIFILPHFWGLQGVEMCQAVSDLFTFLLAIPLSLGVLWEMKRQEAELTPKG